MTYHLLHKYDENTTLCNLYFSSEEEIDASIWCTHENEWLNGEPPTCETCILLNFQDSTNTSRCGP